MNQLKALVLAGGFGTRLRPLSCTRPKMLFPVANQPLLDWALQNLSQGGVETVILAVNYMAEALVRYFARAVNEAGNESNNLFLLTTSEGNALAEFAHDQLHMIQ
jgi:NDP-sugar pyrophosphorylase family protein